MASIEIFTFRNYFNRVYFMLKRKVFSLHRKYFNLLCIFYLIFANVFVFYYLFAPTLNQQTNTNAAKNIIKYYYYGENDFCRLGLDVNEDILKVLNISNAHRIQLFLFELNRLAKYASEPQLNALKEHIFFDSGFNVSHINANEISFGFFDHFAKDNEFTDFIEEIKLNCNFVCETIRYKSEINFERSTIVEMSGHRMLCSNRRTAVHLIRFTRRHDFYWFVEQTNALIFTGNYTQNSNKNDDTFLSAFDEFNLTRCYINDMHWYLPRDFTYFMAQTKASRYVSCDLNGAKQFHEKNPNLTRIDQTLEIKVKKMIVSLKQIMANELKQFWLMEGTLLGWYRGCGLFSYTNDLDLATWHHYANQQFTETLRNNRHNFYLRYIFGFYDEAYEVGLHFEDFKADLFFTYLINNTLYAIATHIIQSYMYSYYYYPKYEICSGELFGIRVNVPCNPRDIIVNAYGEIWREPIEYWNCYDDPLNKGNNIYWSEARKNKSFQSL